MKWQDVRVGDLIHLSNNETVPADILLLRTSESHGACYIDTCDLDGETNLKRREVINLCLTFTYYLFSIQSNSGIHSFLTPFRCAMA